jgi:hypothetical protein
MNTARKEIVIRALASSPYPGQQGFPGPLSNFKLDRPLSLLLQSGSAKTVTRTSGNQHAAIAGDCVEVARRVGCRVS